MTLLTIIRQFTEVSNIVQHLSMLKRVGGYGNVFGDVIVFTTLTILYLLEGLAAWCFHLEARYSFVVIHINVITLISSFRQQCQELSVAGRGSWVDVHVSQVGLCCVPRHPMSPGLGLVLKARAYA